MVKAKVFRVLDCRILFKCPSCRGKRMITIHPGVRRRAISCLKCHEAVHCTFDRRQSTRTPQTGRVVLVTSENEAEVMLFDISDNGVGFEMDIRHGSKLAIGREVQFKCNWNFRLLDQHRYIIKSIKGQRVGAERRR